MRRPTGWAALSPPGTGAGTFRARGATDRAGRAAAKTEPGARPPRHGPERASLKQVSSSGLNRGVALAPRHGRWRGSVTPSLLLSLCPHETPEPAPMKLWLMSPSKWRSSPRRRRWKVAPRASGAHGARVLWRPRPESAAAGRGARGHRPATAAGSRGKADGPSLRARDAEGASRPFCGAGAGGAGRCN